MRAHSPSMNHILSQTPGIQTAQTTNLGTGTANLDVAAARIKMMSAWSESRFFGGPSLLGAPSRQELGVDPLAPAANGKTAVHFAAQAGQRGAESKPKAWFGAPQKQKGFFGGVERV